MVSSIKTSSQYNNSGLHVFIPYLIACLHPQHPTTKDLVSLNKKNKARFCRTPGFKAFLKSFVTYYDLSNEKEAFNQLQKLLIKYPHPLDLQVLLGPVLRLMLKTILFHDENYQKTIKIQHAAVKKKDWQKFYKDHCEIMSSASQCLDITQEEIKVTCQSFHFDLRFYPRKKRCVKMKMPLASLVVNNNIDVAQWEIQLPDDTKWNNEFNRQNQSQFRNYHDASINLFMLNNEVAIDALQIIFKNKINRLLTKKEVFKEELFWVIPNAVSNNNGYEIVTNTIAKIVLRDRQLLGSKNQKVFEGTDGFKHFLEEFRNYYCLGDHYSHRKILSKLKYVLNTYHHSVEREKILTPVIKKMLSLNNEIESELTLAQMQLLCQQFKIKLEVYLGNESEQVSIFQQYHLPTSPTKKIYTLSTVLEPNGWRRVEKDSVRGVAEIAAITYGASHAFRHRKRPAKRLEQQKQIQQGISTFLKKGIFYADNSTCILSKKIEIDVAYQKWPKLFKAVFSGNVQEAQKYLQEKANWRVKVKFKNNKRTKKLDALSLAAMLDDRVMVSLILHHSHSHKDKVLIRKAYDIACQHKCNKALYALLNAPCITHGEKALLNAIDAHDLFLFNELKSKGASWVKYKDFNSRLRFSYQRLKSNPKNEAFNLALQNILFPLNHKKEHGFDAKSLNLIKRGLERSPAWVTNVIAYLDKSGANREKVLEILQMLARQANQAIDKNNTQKLSKCIAADKRCLLINGKYNPLHHAVETNKYHLVKKITINHAVLNVKKMLKRSLSKYESKVIRQNAIKEFNAFAPIVYDRFNRTLAFRLKRKKNYQRLKKQIHHSKNWSESIRLNASLALFKLDEGRIYTIDRLAEKVIHTSKVKNNSFYRYGQIAFYSVSSIGSLVTAGPIRYGLNLAWTLTPSLMKEVFLTPIAKAVGYAASYVSLNEKKIEYAASIVIENTLSIAFFPHYYLASTVLGTGVYYLFKDSDKDKTEAMAYLLADGISHMASTNSNHSLDIDERYYHQLDKNLTPFVGAWCTSMLSPVIANIDFSYQSAHLRINQAIDVIKPYIGRSWLERFKSEAVTHFINEWQDTKKMGEEHIFNFLESTALSLINDSEFKNERLHAMQVYETSRLYAQHIKLTEAKTKDRVDGTLLDKSKILLAKAFEKQENLFKKLRGYQHYQAWQDKHLALQIAKQNRAVNAEQLACLEKEAQDLLKVSQFHNCELTNQNGKWWQESLDEIFVKNRDNFIDWTNLPEVINHIVAGTMDIYDDRNLKAIFCANEIIRILYPLNADLCEPSIQQEWEKHFYTIINDKLEGCKHHRNRTKERLYDYIFAVLTNTKVKKHVHRAAKILKPFLNELLGNSIGYVPFKGFKGGTHSLGSTGLQWNSGRIDGSQVELIVANTPVYTVYDSMAMREMDETISSKEFTSKFLSFRAKPIQAQSLRTQPIENESLAAPNPAMRLDNPYIAEIIEDQFQDLFGEKKKDTKQEKIKTKSHDKATKQKKVIPKPQARTKSSNLIQTKNAPTTVVPSPTARAVNNKVTFNDLKKYAIEAGHESIEEFIEGIKSLLDFVGNEVKRGVQREELAIQKAIRLLGVFIGEEAARIALNEQTHTAKAVLDFVEEYKKMSQHEKAKALTKFVVSNALLPASLKVLNAPIKKIPKQIKPLPKSQQQNLSKKHKYTPEEYAKLKLNKKANKVKKRLEAEKKIEQEKIKALNPRKLTGFMPMYNLHIKDAALKHQVATPGGLSRFKSVIRGISKEEAREFFRRNNLGLSKAQIAIAKDALSSNSTKHVNLKITNKNILKISLERPGYDGFQRLSHEIESDGNRTKFIQTAFDSKGIIIRQRPGANKDNIYDRKFIYERKKKKNK